MNIFKLMQAMRPYIQRGDMTYDLAIKYLKERGVQFDGLVKKALDNMFKTVKARDPVFDQSVTQMPIDEAGVPFNPKTFKSTKEKRAEGIRGTSEADKDIAFIQEGIDDLNKVEREADLVSQKEGVENLFKETKRVNIPADKLNHQMIADQAGIDVELIKGKNWVEILEVLKGLKKADGGRIGYDIGGLTGQAKNIYDSWISAGHSSQDALDYLSSRGMYETGDGGGGGGIESIINTQQSIVPGGNQYNTTPIGTQIANFNQARAARQTRLENPNTIQSLINNYTGGGQRTVNKMLQSGNIGDFRKTQGLPLGIGAGIARMLPDKYYDLPVQDQAFIQSMMGFEDEGGMSNKDPFGINVRSMFGNYANYVRNINQKLAGREFKPGSWQDQRQKFYAEIEKDRVRQEEAAKAAAARDIALYAEAQRTGDADAASGAGGNVDPGGPASRMDWSDLTDDEGDKYATGGVATMFTRRR